MFEHSDKKRINNILLVAITRMGDMLQASPSIVGLRRENPHAKITVLIDTQFAPICKGIPGIDEVYVVDLSMLVRCIHRGGDGIVEAYRYMTDMVKDLRDRNFDYCLNMSSSSYTAILLKILNVKQSRGWLSDDEGFRVISDPWAMLFAAFVYHSNRDYNSLNLVDIFRCAAGVKDHPNHLVFQPDPEDNEFAASFLDSSGIAKGSGPLIAIQAGASQVKRQWPPAAFAAVIKRFVEEFDARVLLTGAKSEQPLIADILGRYSHPRVVSAVGKTNVAQLAALLQRADVLVTGDTGPMHLAVAVNTPVVAMFLASALCFETGPYGEGNIVIQPQIGCNPCNPNYPCSRPDCHAQVTPEMVVQLTKIRLETPRGSEASIELPFKLKEQRAAAIYVTQFDRDQFLEFRLLGGVAPREGESAEYFMNARDAYRALWKEEFEQISFTELKREETLPMPLVHPTLTGIPEAIKCCQEGQKLLGELVRLVQDPHSPPQELKKINLAISSIDQQIEEVGLSYPILGAMIRIFLMEKENLRGNDVLYLASETEKLYQRLIRRSHRLARLYAYFESKRRGTRDDQRASGWQSASH